ncbi:tRNA-Val4 [Cytobacillus firmus]|uniref:tRNA-Val4 n=1 Tax=Cytobacillus firmus TaxID=1399 RepID=UPI001C8ED387|nr:tRNA-Val4 [Cytobacillus firmus]MBX9976533.1 tRNA-Val4 [Cytobacillus firmus]
MRYPYEFKKDPFGDIGIVLPDEISLFSDFIENIATEEQVDEYKEYIERVLGGEYEDFEIELNATSVYIKRDVTIIKNNFRIEEPYENKIETEQFIELLLIWREKIQEIFKG